ncbi:MAG TPA: prepilin-type N-terminal cleavage/methylation domain-containing protein [Nevskiaceae bacterium]|nr:prepilin-type N-terminal cleavage/methylation domain-containing protein [Nevskiaceae bacterium]
MKKGFTLIELLVVMAILGLLATIGLVSFRTAQLKGRDARRKHDLEQIQKALEMYFNDKGQYPVPTIPSGGGYWQDTDVVDGALYMKKVPSDPKGGNYCYTSDVNGGYYKLYAQLENENDPGCLNDGDCLTERACGAGTYNYGVSSSNESP